ncbi:MAG: dynamin family protein [Deltaproteobacteria bacterium]|nr:dynamin family protein [Deltaproteobacteria bacterium]
MDRFNSLQKELYSINQDIFSLLSETESIPGMSKNKFTTWSKNCEEIRRQIQEAILRVAIVGPIKSGKSTFTNYLFHGDYLKRSAGVVTSIVTKIQKGASLKVKLFFKSWDEVNTDMLQAMVLMPSLSYSAEKHYAGSANFDIRRSDDRINLHMAIDSLSDALLISNGILNPQIVLLSSYLEGYQVMQEKISPDTSEAEFDAERFDEHKALVSDDSLSVYLKDIQITIDTGFIGNNIEIADCQGSDSPNPLHLTMIQDYLFYANLIIYVISSRTGLRQADIKFLSIIKKMGIMDNMIFVINCDFNEHDTITDLTQLIKNIKKELSIFLNHPEVYSFSALLNLFKSINSNSASRNGLKEKELAKLNQWKGDKEFYEFSNRGTESFEASFTKKLTQERYSLLLKNHIERFGIIAAGIKNYVCINQKILGQDSSNAKKIIKGLKENQEKMSRIKDMIKSTLSGAVQTTKKEIRIEVDRFFNSRSGNVIGDLINFIKKYRLVYEKYEKNLDLNGFANTLYLVFQDFKMEIDAFMAERLNPEVIRFIKEKERYIEKQLESVAVPYETMVKDALLKYTNGLSDFGINSMDTKGGNIAFPGFDSIKAGEGLIVPPVVAHMHFSAKIKTEAIMRLGFYNFIKFIKKIFKKETQDKKEEALALKKAVFRIKQETEKAVIFHFINYQENLKFQYFFKFIDAASNSYYKALVDQFHANSIDHSNITTLIGKKQTDKEYALKTLKKMEPIAEQIYLRIKSVKKELS